MHLPSGHGAAELGRDLAQLEPGDEGGQMMGVGADVAEHQGRAALLGHEAPVGGRVAIGLVSAASWPWMYSTCSCRIGAELAALHHGRAWRTIG